jgi:hypothetical protein
VNNYTAVALTKLDILDGFDEIKVGVEYLKDGKKLDHFPSSEQVPNFIGSWLKCEYFISNISSAFLSCIAFLIYVQAKFPNGGFSYKLVPIFNNAPAASKKIPNSKAVKIDPKYLSQFVNINL